MPFTKAWNTKRSSLLAGLLLAAMFAPAQTVPSSPQADARPADSPQETTAPNAAPMDSRDRIFYPGDTERLKPLTGKLLGNTLLDQKEIWTSPFHMRRKDVKWWVGIAGVTGALIATDHRTINTFENSQGQVSWGNNISRIGASYTLLPVVAGFYTYGVLRDDPKPREVGVLGGEALLDSLIVVEVLKAAAGRNRPDNPTHPGHFFKGGDSFPSGHAIESWSLASVIAHEYGHGSKVVPIVVYSLAGVVSAARFTAQRHYAADIVAGGALGWFLGRYVYQTHMDHSIHRHLAGRPRITPVLEPTQKLYGLAVAFGD